jgi:hypothetical protein
MAPIKPRWSKVEFAKRGDAIFEKDIRPHLKNEDDDDFVAIDLGTGAYEIDANELAACDRLRARVPDAQVWLRKVGSRFARRFGGRGRPTAK